MLMLSTSEIISLEKLYANTYLALTLKQLI